MIGASRTQFWRAETNYYLAGCDCIARNEQFREDVVKVPLKGFATQLLSETLSARHVAIVSLFYLKLDNPIMRMTCKQVNNGAYYPVVPDSLVIVLWIFIQPDFCQADVVALEDVDSAAPLVGRAFSENVSDVTARNDFQRSATHPRLTKRETLIRFNQYCKYRVKPWRRAPNSRLPKCRIRHHKCPISGRRLCLWRTIRRP